MSTAEVVSSKLILVRHAQTHWDFANRYTGSKDIKLSSQGIWEAKSLGIKLKSLTVDCAFTSALSRARQTLIIIEEVADFQDLVVKTDGALNARNYGDLEGINKLDAKSIYGESLVNQWIDQFDRCPPKGESLKDVYYRVIPFFEYLIRPKLEAGETVLLVSHEACLHVLKMYLDKLSPEEVVVKEVNTVNPIFYYWPVDSRINR